MAPDTVSRVRMRIERIHRRPRGSGSISLQRTKLQTGQPFGNSNDVKVSVRCAWLLREDEGLQAMSRQQQCIGPVSLMAVTAHTIQEPAGLEKLLGVLGFGRTNS